MWMILACGCIYVFVFKFICALDHTYVNVGMCTCEHAYQYV